MQSPNVLSAFLPPTRCPAAGFGPEFPHRGSRSEAKCECDPTPLLLRVCELADAVDWRASELKELHEVLYRAPAASPELAALASENGALVRQARESTTKVSTLRTELASAAWVLDTNKQRAFELKTERRRLLERLGSLERSDAAAQQAASTYEAEMAQERSQAEGRTIGQEAAVAQLTHKAESAEKRWQSSEALAAKLCLATVEAESMAAESSRASAADAQKHLRESQDIELRLSQEEALLLKAQAAEAQMENSPDRLCSQQMAMAREHIAELLSAEQVLQERLETAQCAGDNMEEQALGVARELVDASHAISWLQAEVESLRALRSQISELQQDNRSLQQRLLMAADTGSFEAGRDQDASASSPERATDVQSVNKALHAAWEAEAQEHRVLQRRHQQLQATMQPLRQQLTRIAGVVQRWRRELGSQTSPKGSQSVWLEDSSGGTTTLDVSAVQSLCRSVEGLTAETARALILRSQEVQAEEDALAMATLRSMQAQEARATRSAELERRLAVPERAPFHVSYAPGVRQSAPSLGSSIAPARSAPCRPPEDRFRGVDPDRGVHGPLYRLEHPGWLEPVGSASGFPRLPRSDEVCFDHYSVHKPRFHI